MSVYVDRSAVPMLKRGLASFGKQALSTGLQVASDMADGASFSDSAKLRAREGIKRLANDGVDYLNANQSGSGYRRVKRRRRSAPTRSIRKRVTRKRAKAPKKRRATRKRKRRRSDIFS